MTRPQASAVEWSRYETAYGSARAIPKSLARLTSSNERRAKKAAHDLWCALCHQHANISSAAAPAFPFLLDALDAASDAVKPEILDILLGFLRCDVDAAGASPPWIASLHDRLAAARPRFVSLAASPSAEVASFASAILSALDSRARP
jgi:hypothetical protein